MKPTAILRRLGSFGMLGAMLWVPARGSLAVASLNCTFLLSPATAAQLGVPQSADAGSIYAERFDNLARLIAGSGAEFVGLESIGDKREVEDLAVRISGLSGATWKGIFILGAGRQRGRNLAVVYRPRRGLEITGAGPIRDLADVRPHLVFTLMVDEAPVALCLVDLTFPGAADPETHEAQLQALVSWAGQQNGTAVIMGTFNEPHRRLSPLFSVNERLGWPPTGLGNQAGDYIFSTKALALGEVIAPPYGANPSGIVRSRWTDHFLVKVLIP